MEAETLSDAERAELATLAEESEGVAVARAEAVGELTRRHNVSPDQALAALNRKEQRRG